MFELLKAFLNSQLFGIILGSILTCGFTWFIECRKTSREEKIYLKRKREQLYEQLYDFVMRFEKDVRIHKSTYMRKETKDLYNSIEKQTIWASKNVADAFYDLFGEIYETPEEYKKNWEETHIENNKKILKFKEYLRQELRIKD